MKTKILSLAYKVPYGLVLCPSLSSLTLFLTPDTLASFVTLQHGSGQAFALARILSVWNPLPRINSWLTSSPPSDLSQMSLSPGRHSYSKLHFPSSSNPYSSAFFPLHITDHCLQYNSVYYLSLFTHALKHKFQGAEIVCC